MSGIAAIDTVLLALRRRWGALPASQQRTGAIIAAVIVLVVGYAFIWLPVMREHDRLALRLPQLQAQLRAMQLQADEFRRISALPAGAGKPGAMPDAGALQATFGPTARISTAPDRSLNVQIPKVPYAQWWDRLGEAQSRHGLQLKALKVTPTADAGPAHEVSVDMQLAERAGGSAR